MFISKFQSKNTCPLPVTEYTNCRQPVDIDNLGLFQSYTDIHSWTSTSIIDNKALIVTKKITSVVTIEELRKLSAHLGVTLKLDETRNGRVWASKNNGHLVKSKFQNNTTGGGS